MKIMSESEYAKETLQGKSRLAGEPLNLPYPEPEIPEGASLVAGPDGLYAMPRPAEPAAKPKPWSDGPPTAEQMAALVEAQTNAAAYLAELRTELAELPEKTQATILAGDYAELARLKERGSLLPYEIQGAEITAAKARVATAEARVAKARAERDAAGAEAHRLGQIGGYPEGKEKGDLATQAYGEAAAQVSMAAYEAGYAKRILAALMAEALAGK
jgi:hypothetical protein